MWDLVLEIFFGGLPLLKITSEMVRGVAAAFELDASVVHEALKSEHAGPLLDGIKDAGKTVAIEGKRVFFAGWVDDQVSDLAKSRSQAMFATVPLVDAKDVKVQTRKGILPAHGHNQEFDHWMGYGDSHDMWPRFE
jgi:hypothetical protein